MNLFSKHFNYGNFSHNHIKYVEVYLCKFALAHPNLSLQEKFESAKYYLHGLENQEKKVLKAWYPAIK